MELQQDVTECKTDIADNKQNIDDNKQDIQNINTRYIPLNIQSKLIINLLSLLKITCLFDPFFYFVLGGGGGW